MRDCATSGRGEDSAVFAPGHLGVLTEYLPAEVIDEILAETCCAQQRIRLLPARVVMHFVLALTLFPQRGYGRVWDILVRGMAAPVLVSLSALKQARQRLGVMPLAALWDWACRPLARPGRHGAFYRRWRLLAWDATTLDVPATERNATRFAAAGGSAGVSGYLKVQLLGLVECGTRAFVGGTFGGIGHSEKTLAWHLLDKLTRDVLLLADRNYHDWRLWHTAAATGADLLWRVRANAYLPMTSRLPDGSYVSRFPHRKTRRDDPDPLPVRVIDAVITITTADGHCRNQPYRLITTITDHHAAPADELIELYARRWDIETAYYCWKTLQQGRDAVLRSKTPTGVDQEIYAYLITCQALRTLAHDAAEDTGQDCHQIRFTGLLDAATDSIAEHHTQLRLHTPPAHRHATALHQVAQRPLPRNRPPRSCPRARKRPVSKFRSKRPETPTTQHVNYKITINQPLTTHHET